MSKVQKADLAGAIVTLGGADVTDSVIWVDVVAGRALVCDAPGQSRFATGVFLIEREEEVTLLEVEAEDDIEPVAEETIHEAEPQGQVRSRKRPNRSRS